MPPEGNVDAKGGTARRLRRFAHDLHLPSRNRIDKDVTANYVDNLSEEVRKGLLVKAEQGHWPSRAPVGYVDNLATQSARSASDDVRRNG